MKPDIFARISDKRHTQVMGIVNTTPDSFYDGGLYLDTQQVRERIHQIIDDGADIIDIGAESSRPGAEPIGLHEELQRALPAFEIAAETGHPFSVDTWRAETARRAIALGAVMVNDITALRGDPEMAAVVAEAGCACVLMHLRGSPKTMQEAPYYEDVVSDVTAFFEERIEFALRCGIPKQHIWLDPGFGFGKTVNHNLELLRRVDEFLRFDMPVLIGTSNKSTIGAVLNAAPDERTEGTAATVAIAVCKGVHCVRVHDVKAMARVTRMCDAILRGRSEVDA